MMKKKVFVSYDHSEDIHYIELLRAWKANLDFDFNFNQHSPKNVVNSFETNIIEEALTKQMKEFEYILVVVGKGSHLSKWMEFEIDRAKSNSIRLKFAAVKIDKNFINPNGLPIPATSFAYSFTLDSIVNALKQARNRY